MLEACPSVLSPQAKATVPVTTTDPESRRFSEGDSTDPRTRAGPRRRPTPREARPGAAEGHPAFAGDALGDATRPQRVVGLPPPPPHPGYPRTPAPLTGRWEPAPASAPAPAPGPRSGSAAAQSRHRPARCTPGVVVRPPARPTAPGRRHLGQEATLNPGNQRRRGPAFGKPIPIASAAEPGGTRRQGQGQNAGLCSGSIFIVTENG